MSFCDGHVEAISYDIEPRLASMRMEIVVKGPSRVKSGRRNTFSSTDALMDVLHQLLLSCGELLRSS